jgi:hypothetical protein
LPTEEAKFLLSVLFGVKEKLCSSKFIFTLPELEMEFTKVVVDIEFPESLKFFFFIEAFSE